MTLKSLANAGFDGPRLFIDGARDVRDYSEWILPITCRFPAVSITANWILGMTELYVREPSATRFAMFQDDLVVCKNLRAYLDSCSYPEAGYWNLYNVPENENASSGNAVGWYPSKQNGRGALGLVFSREALLTLLRQPTVMNRLQSSIGWKSVDGMIIDSLKKIGWVEYVHKPGLIQHIGKHSTLRNNFKAISSTFPGEDFDPMQILCPGIEQTLNC